MWWLIAETRFSLSAERTNPFKSEGASVQWTNGIRIVCNSVINAGYTMFRGSVKGTGYAIHSQVSPSLPCPCVNLCHHISTGAYYAPNTKRILSDSISPHRLMLGMYCREGIHLFLLQSVMLPVHSGVSLGATALCRLLLYKLLKEFSGADKSLARHVKKHAAPVKSVMGRGIECFG